MFDSLSSKLGAVFQKLSNRGRLTDKDIDEALKEVRVALLEADVNFKVAREFVAKVKERCMGSEVLQGLNPGQQVVKIVNNVLTEVLDAGDHALHHGTESPAVLMLVGLQGSGKTTTAAKLALQLSSGPSQKTMMVAADLRRPAAVDQLKALGAQLDLPVYSEDPASTTVLKVAKNGIAEAKKQGCPWVIIDTGGQLQIDDELMGELTDLKNAIKPQEAILVVDAMTGQEAVNAAGEFNERVGLTGLILSKMDGDARGGAALSITSVTGVPIKFMGVGEKNDALEPFYPDRLASRILGMGDVLTLIEKAQDVIDVETAQEMERKLRKATFDLQDFLDQLRAVQKMGPLGQVLEMIPGMKNRMGDQQLDEGRIKGVEAIVLSMTPRERREPDVLNASRRRRIAKGSGTSVQEVNQLLNQFRQMQKMMKQFAGGKMRGLAGLGKMMRQ
ncbi:MAG: signal recognition particle protein [SAR202 cluster bacterium]|nr:signal recognition particle protein [SAR202 cluster bacterium]